jgi:hypothetical protein
MTLQEIIQLVLLGGALVLAGHRAAASLVRRQEQARPAHYRPAGDRHGKT